MELLFKIHPSESSECKQYSMSKVDIGEKFISGYIAEDKQGNITLLKDLKEQLNFVGVEHSVIKDAFIHKAKGVQVSYCRSRLNLPCTNLKKNNLEINKYKASLNS